MGDWEPNEEWTQLFQSPVAAEVSPRSARRARPQSYLLVLPTQIRQSMDQCWNFIEKWTVVITTLFHFKKTH